MTTKQCNGCGEWKSLDDFSPARKGLHGRAYYCRPCNAAKKRERYAADLAVREANTDSCREYRRTNAEARVKDNERSRKWRQANLDYVHQAIRDWQKANPERVAAAAARYRKRYPDKVRDHAERRRARKAAVTTSRPSSGMRSASSSAAPAPIACGPTCRFSKNISCR